MKAPNPGALRPVLLPGVNGPLAAVYYAPVGGTRPRGDMLVVPPFAEEMNRCRAMVALQARALAPFGIGTLVLDPTGTGDSAGDFPDSTWQMWRDDLERGIAWLRQHGHGCRFLLGVRLGAIMAAELALRDPAITRLVFWQPVADGKSHYTQFLRIRVAAELDVRTGVKSTKELRQRSVDGELVEVSGYRVGPAMAKALDEVRLPAPAALAAVRVTWFETLAAADVPHGNARLIDEYKNGGVDVAYHPVVGQPFWHLHERTVSPALIESTTAAITAWADGPPSRIDARGGAVVEAGTPATMVSQHAVSEYPRTIACAGNELVAIVHRGAPDARRGVVIVVAGGPQYRAGAHRQFVSLARRLAARGYPVLRFDLRGMGDSSGEHVGYQQSAPDIRAAIDALVAEAPQLGEIVLFGECESASGILFYGYQDPRVKGMALVNPWVRTEEGHAEVILKHYYGQRLWSREFWRKVLSGGFEARASLKSFGRVLRGYLGVRRIRALREGDTGHDDFAALPLPLKTAAGLRRFAGPALILMSGKDYIAREFDEIARSSKAWEGLLEQPRILRRVLTDADHTFSREVWKVQVADWLAEWLESW